VGWIIPEELERLLGNLMRGILLRAWTPPPMAEAVEPNGRKVCATTPPPFGPCPIIMRQFLFPSSYLFFTSLVCKKLWETFFEFFLSVNFLRAKEAKKKRWVERETFLLRGLILTLILSHFILIIQLNR
jgi:hypothetical protein